MPISYKHNCIFIHIPKTGGASITKLLQLTPSIQNYYSLDGITIINFYDNINNYNGWSCPAHLPGPILKQLNPLVFEKFYKFSLVRNPYDRVLSEYCWVNRKDFKPEQSNDLTFINNFKLWVGSLPRILRKKIPNRSTPHFVHLYEGIPSHLIPQHCFLYEGDKLIVDEVFKFEDSIEEIFKKISLKLNIEHVPIHVNKNPFSIDKSLFLTPDTKEIIYKLYQKDFDIFSYSK